MSDGLSGPAKVFGIGLTKTGTTSLYAALNILGYRTVTYRHMKALGAGAWLRGDFSGDILAGVDAATDLPIATYFRELDVRYPGSKFILSVRPMEAWLASIAGQFAPATNGRMPRPFPKAVRMATYGTFGFHEARYRRAAEAHVADARAWFADRPDQFLEFDVFAGHGWPELCAFLGRPVPDVPYPNVKPGYVAPEEEQRAVASEGAE